MATKNKKQNDKAIDLSEYTEEFLERFIEYMAAANSLEKCNAGGIKLVMDLNGDDEFSEDEIKILHALIKADLAKKDKPKNPLIVGMSKQESIARLNKIVNTCKDEKIVMDAIKQLTVLNNWLESSDAEEVIKSNTALIETLNKIFTPAEQEILAFSFVEEEYVSSPVSDDDENESVMSEIEIV